MNYLIRAILSAVVIWLLGTYDILISIDSFKTAVIVAVLISIVGFLVSLAIWGITIVGGLLTGGILFVVGLILFMFAAPITLVQVAKFVDGFTIPSFFNAILLAIILAVFVPRKKHLDD